MSSPEYRVEMRSIKKSFSGIHALKGVDFCLVPGEIHALLGENGAGKSTLMKILSGAYTADEGEILIDGEPVVIKSPRQGKAMGIGIVYQEFALADDLTIAENIFIDRIAPKGFVHWKQLYSDAAELLDRIGFDMDVRAKVGTLSVAYKQMVEIAKALSGNAKILILDEPTAVLSPTETKKLFSMIRGLRDRGVAIVFISHRMDEIFELCDSITVMRDGEVTGGGKLKDFDENSVVELMIGRKLETMYPPRDHEVKGEALLEVKNLTGQAFSDVSFTLHKGELLGFFGLVGSGRTEIMRAIFGADRKTGGEVILNGKQINVKTPAQGKKCGIGLIPESRKEQGLVLDHSIRENMTYCNIARVTSGGVLNRKLEEKLADEMIRRLSIKAPKPELPVASLSGGNQQKVVIAKWLAKESEVVIMDEPTRGVDVGAKAEIYGIINELTEQGCGVMMVSSELNEIIGMCDRVIVIDGGHKVGELSRAEVSEKNIMNLVVGGKQA